MNTEEWLKERQKGIGGTDVAAILGLNPWKTPLQVWEEKMAPAPVEQEETPAMRAGKKLEAAIAEWFTEETGLTTFKAEELIKHPDHPVLFANPDYYYLRPISIPSNENELGEVVKGILEIKTTSKEAYQKWEDEIPISYWCQIQHYMYVTGLKEGKFALLISGRDFRTLDVERDDEWLNIAIPRLLDWWEKHIVGKTPPEPVNNEDIKKLYPKSRPVEVAANEVLLKTVEEWKRVKEQISKLKAHQEELEFQIKAVMKDAEIMKYNGLPLVSWKSSEREYFDSKKFKKENPELYARYAEKRTVRTLRALKVKMEVK